MVSSGMSPAGYAPPPIDPSSPIPWNLLREHLNFQLDRARAGLESIGKTESDYNVLRGEIRTLKNLLDLPNQAARKASITRFTPTADAP